MTRRNRGYAAHLNRANVDWPALRQKVLDYADAVETAQRAIEKAIYPEWGRLLIAPAREAAIWRGEPAPPPNIPAVPIVLDPAVLDGLLEPVDLSDLFRNPIDLSDLLK